MIAQSLKKLSIYCSLRNGSLYTDLNYNYLKLVRIIKIILTNLRSRFFFNIYCPIVLKFAL